MRYSSRLILTGLCLLLLWGGHTEKAWGDLPVSSKYYCLMEAATGQVLTGKNIDTIRPIASTTKVMTAILTAEYCGLDEVATVSSSAAKTLPYTIKLRAGQVLTIDELMKVALLRSANDAAVVMAEHVAGDEAFFAHLMTLKAFSLGAVNTHFTNASGLPAEDHHSTVYDLALISCYALQQPIVSNLIATNEASFKHPSNQQPAIIMNTNPLLRSYPGANGVKTGTTNAAGHCLIAAAKRDGRQLVAVTLNSGNRAGDCTTLLDYGYKSTEVAKIIDKDEVFKDLFLPEDQEAYLEVYPAQDVIIWQGKESLRISKRVDMRYDIQASVEKGEKLGELHIYVNDKYLTAIDLMAGKSIAKHSRPWFNLLAGVVTNIQPLSVGTF